MQASKWLKNPKILAEINQRLAGSAKKLNVTADRVLAELAKLAFFDPRKMFNPDGSPKQILDLDDETAACVAGLEVNELFEGDGDQKYAYRLIKKIKLCDKRAALVDLGRHLNLFTEKVELTGANGTPLIPAPLNLSKLSIDELKSLRDMAAKAAPDAATQ